MLVFLSSILIIIAILCFGLGYAYLTNKAEGALLWSFTGNLAGKVIDKEKYKKQQGKFLSVLGVIFLFVPISLYFVNRFEMKKELLYLWILALGVVVLLNTIQARKNFR